MALIDTAKQETRLNLHVAMHKSNLQRPAVSENKIMCALKSLDARGPFRR